MAFALLATACRPAGSQRAAAIVTHHRPTQRKILDEVGTVDRAQTVQAILNPLMRFEGDQRLVMSLAARDLPLRSLDVTRINRIAQHVADTLMRELAALWFWKKRMRFKEALHIGLTAKATGGVPFQRLDDDGGFRLFPNQHVAVQSGDTTIATTARSRENGEAVLKPRLHAMHSLFGIVDTVIVCERDRHVLHKPRARRAVINDAGRLQDGIAIGHGFVEMRAQVGVTHPSVEVIEQDTEPLFPIGSQKGEQRL